MIRKIVTKNLVLAGLVVLNSVSLNANQSGTGATATVTQANRTGIYVGAAIGIEAMTGKSYLFVNRNIGVPASQNFNRNISDKNIAGDFFIGYGKRFNCFWMAIEAIGSLTSLNSKDVLDISGNNTNQTLSTKTTHGWGGSVNLGWYINPTNKLYLKLGLESRRFNINFANPDAIDPMLSLNKSYRTTAFVPGFGVEVDLTPCFSVRTEYRLAMHPKKTVQVSNSPTQQTSVQTKSSAIHYFNLGLIFKM